MDIGASLNLVSRFARSHVPRAAVVLLAGSRARGNADTTADYDVVVLFRDLTDGGAWREMVRFEGADVELFAHDLGTLAYFCEEVERPSGEPGLAVMIREGIPAVLKDPDLLERARHTVEEMLEKGPARWDDEVLRARRYAITDLADALRSPLEPGKRVGIGSSLYAALAEMALRGNGRWGGGGKGTDRALSAWDQSLQGRFAEAFCGLYTEAKTGEVQQLVDDVLAPFGGRLRAGFRQQAPRTWRR